MVKGIGTDIVSIKRIEESYQKYKSKFIERLLTSAEKLEWHNKNNSIVYLAGRWAAKEAVGKALQCGISCGLKNIEILATNTGAPEVKLYGKASEIAQKMGIVTVFLSISHEQSYAVAFAITEG